MKTSTSKARKPAAAKKVAAEKRAPAAKKTAAAKTAPAAKKTAAAKKPAATKPVAVVAKVPAAASVPVAQAAPLAKLLLPARLQINNLDTLYAACCKLLGSKQQHVVVDGGDITLCDSAGVQLLVAFFRSFTANGGKVEWENYSVQLYQMADELGVSGQLGG